MTSVVAPTAIQAGQTVKFTASVAPNEAMSDVNLNFAIGKLGGSSYLFVNTLTNLTLPAGQSTSEVYDWTVPTNLAAGQYVLTVWVANAATNGWAIQWAGDNAANTFSVVAISPTNGLVGADKNKDFATLSSTDGNLCAAGGPVNFKATSTGWTWGCAGTDGGTTDNSGVATLLVNGSCGPSNAHSFSSVPTANLCAAGSASAVSGTGPWAWSCSGVGGGKAASCSASIAGAPVAGQCGVATAVASSSAPTSQLCASGVASAVSGPINWVGYNASSGIGAGKWAWSCKGVNGGSTSSCLGATALPGKGAPVDAAGETGKTSYATLPFMSNVYGICWGCSVGLEPMQLFAGANAKSFFADANGTNDLGSSRGSAFGLEASGIVPSAGAQRWQDTWVAAFPTDTASYDGLTMTVDSGDKPFVDGDRQSNNMVNQPEFGAWRDWYTNHPQYWNYAFDGGTLPQSWRSWNGQWGYVTPMQPLDPADCPSDMTSCTFGDLWAFLWAKTSAMTGGYGIQLSDFSDSIPYEPTNVQGFNSRIIAAFATTNGLSIPGNTIAEQGSWIVANAYSKWNDFIATGEGKFFDAIASRLTAATGRQALVDDQCQGTPFWLRSRGIDHRIIAQQISGNNYLCIHDEHVMNPGGDRAGPIVNPVTREIGPLATTAAYEPLLRHGGNLEADDTTNFWPAVSFYYPSLSSAEQTEVGYKLLKRLWLDAAWAHIADRSGNTRRALAFASRDYWDIGTLTASQLGPLQTLIQTIVPSQPFGPAVYYSSSAVKGAETFFAATYGSSLDPASVDAAKPALQQFIDQGGAVGYFVSDASLSEITAGSANAPSAWIVLQDVADHDALGDLPSSELSQLKAIAPVVDLFAIGESTPGAMSAVNQLNALPNQPLTFTTNGGPAAISAACLSAGYTQGSVIKANAMTGFGFFDQNHRLTVVVSNPNPCPDATTLSGTVSLKGLTKSGASFSGTAVVTNLFTNTTTDISVKNGAATIPMTLARWDSTALAITF
jgi:hypothetical protein